MKLWDDLPSDITFAPFIKILNEFVLLKELQFELYMSF